MKTEMDFEVIQLHQDISQMRKSKTIEINGYSELQSQLWE